MLKPFTALLALVLGTIAIVVSNSTDYATATPATRVVDPAVSFLIDVLGWATFLAASGYLLSVAFNRRIARLAELSLFVFIVGFFMAVLADDGREVTFYSYEEIAIWTEIIVFVVLPILDKTLAPKDDRPRRKKKHEDVWIDYEPEDEGDALIGIDADGQMILTREQ